MRLNGAALNRRPLGGAARLPVYGQADFSLGVTSGVTATRTQYGVAHAVLALVASFSPHVIRNGASACVLTLDPSLAQTVARSGTGEGVLGVDASLYYTRTMYGSGAAEIGIHWISDVGVVFIDGHAVMAPGVAVLDATRRVHSSGTGHVDLLGALAPSALRRSLASVIVGALDGQLEASHVNAQGQRYVGFGGAAASELAVEDAGMLRQSFIGSVDFEIQATARGTSRKPTLAGARPFEIAVGADFRVSRRGQGTAALGLSAALRGEVHVRGSGAAPLVIQAAGTGYRQTFNALGASVVATALRMDGRRAVMLAGATPLVTEAGGVGARCRVGTGDWVLDVSSDGTPYAIRGGEGAFGIELEGDLDADIFVPGTGAALIALTAFMAGRRQLFPQLVTPVAVVGAELEAQRQRLSGGSLTTPLVAVLPATRIQHGRAVAALEVLGESDAYLNPASHDITEQQFRRPAQERIFRRPAVQREWRRT